MGILKLLDRLFSKCMHRNVKRLEGQAPYHDYYECLDCGRTSDSYGEFD